MGIPFHEVRQWSAAEVILYACYYRIAPWGEDRADIRNAMNMAQTANMHRDPTKHPQPFEIDNFMPFREKADEDEDEGDGSAAMRGMFKKASK